MKTYTFETSSDEWVPADVARAMYEALLMLDNDEFSHLSPLTWERMKEALATADGEAQ